MNFRKAERTITTLKSVIREARSDHRFEILWNAASVSAMAHGLDEPVLPRRRKVPARLTGTGQAHFASTPEEHYRRIYFETMDHLISGLDTQFEPSETTEHLAKVGYK